MSRIRLPLLVLALAGVQTTVGAIAVATHSTLHRTPSQDRWQSHHCGHEHHSNHESSLPAEKPDSHECPVCEFLAQPVNRVECEIELTTSEIGTPILIVYQQLSAVGSSLLPPVRGPPTVC